MKNFTIFPHAASQSLLIYQQLKLLKAYKVTIFLKEQSTLAYLER